LGRIALRREQCNESATACSAGTLKAAYSQLLLCTAVASRDKDSAGGPATRESEGGTEGHWPRRETVCVVQRARECGVASECVCCVWTSDTVIERSRKGIVHLGRDTEFEWRQGRTRRSDRIRAHLFAREINSWTSSKALSLHT